MKHSKRAFFIILIITLALGYLSFFGISTIGIKGASQMRFGIDIRGGVSANFSAKDLDRMPTSAELDSTRHVIETRLDQMGILDREVTVDRNNGFVMVRFPWKSTETNFDPATAIRELGVMAHLTFKDPDGNIVLAGSQVVSAAAVNDTQNIGQYVVNLTLSSDGRDAFSEATGRLIGQKISIYMDDTLISAPTVNTQINSNNCQITHIGSFEEAQSLAIQINSGSLPYSLESKDYSAISPTLGSNALDIMVYAGVLAFVLICIALILYYRMSGVVACISLVLHVAGQLFFFSLTQITITLPGIAGIILSIGIAVDANIIEAERIRDELRKDKSVQRAIADGFKRSWPPIFDGNFTVLIVSIMMMIFGTGTMLSFAYTLLTGLVMNFIAGVGATRLMTYSIVNFKKICSPTMFITKKLYARKEDKTLRVIQKMPVFYAISGVIILIGIIMIPINGIQLDIQFKGGAIIDYSATDAGSLNVDEAARAVADALNGRIVDGQLTTDYATGEKKLELSLSGNQQLTNEDFQTITTTLQEKYPEQNFVVYESNTVSAFLGAQFLQNGLISIAVSFLLIMLYVWFRFKKQGTSAGVTALISLIHDVLIIMAVFIVFRIPIGDSFIAVALTILGYSINDTIVVYDRIRENANIFKKMPVGELVNVSISQTLTRSINTTVSVFVSILLVFIFAAVSNLASIRDFAFPMCIGIVSGCYSSVCIAGPLWAKWQEHKLPQQGGPAKKAAKA